MNILLKVGRRIRRDIFRRSRLIKYRRMGLRFEPPNYLFMPHLGPDPVVVDAGCGYQADFSLMMIRDFGARAVGVDPTRKHKAALDAVAVETNGRFRHIPAAIGANDGTAVFFESITHESGSFLARHVNVMKDQTIQYEVRVMSLATLLREVGRDQVAILKLDLEGAEYQLLTSVGQDDLRPFRQIFVEFHHHAVGGVGEDETRRIVGRLESLGYRSFSVDRHNFLFLQT